jgi:predicted transcriptional regulator
MEGMDVSSKSSQTIRDQIQDRMRQLGISKSDLARRVGKSRQWIGDLLNQDDEFLLSTVEPVFEALGMELTFRITNKTTSVSA